MKTLAAFLCLLNIAFAADEVKLKATVPLPGVKGRFDHFAVDTNAHRLFIAALGNNTLEIIDGAAAKRLHTITGLHKPTGVAFLPGANQIVVANGDDGTVKVFDGTNYKLVKNISGLDDADNVRIDTKANRIYVGYGDGALTAIDAQKWEQVSTIKLKAHPESFQLEQNGNRIFVNVPDAKHIAVLDRERRNVIATWPMEKFRANFPMAFDETNHRLFVGCRQPARTVVIDTETGKPIADFAISGDTDDLFWDVARKRIYVSCGEGFLDVFSNDRGTFTRIGQLATRGGARTSYFAPQFSQLYVAVPERGGASAELRIFTTE
jgi:DNA-binding beta-propeller fold protein YncE